MLKLNRRNVLTGFAASVLVAFGFPANANPLIWILRLFFTGAIRRGFVARLFGRKAVNRSGSRVLSGSSGAAGRSANRSNLTSIKTPQGKKYIKNANKFSVRKMLVEEAAIAAGFSFIMPEDLGMDMGGIIGISQVRADEIKSHNAVAIWISDQSNEITLHGKNMSDAPIADFLTIGLKDQKTDELLYPQVFPIIVDPQIEFEIGPLKFKNLPTGPKIVEAFLTNHGATVVFQQQQASIVVAHPHEVIQMG